MDTTSDLKYKIVVPLGIGQLVSCFHDGEGEYGPPLRLEVVLRGTGEKSVMEVNVHSMYRGKHNFILDGFENGAATPASKMKIYLNRRTLKGELIKEIPHFS